MRANRYVTAIWRGFLIVSLTSVNVGQIAGHHYGGAFCCGGAISWVWWRNAHSAAHDDLPHLRECYALGAGLGTITGMLLTAWAYG